MDAKTHTTLFIGAIAIIVAALFWSIDGTFIRPHLYALPAGLVVLTEHLLGFLVLIPFLLPRLRQLKNLDKKKHLFGVFLFGIVAATAKEGFYCGGSVDSGLMPASRRK